MNTESKVAELLLKSGAIILRPQQPFKYASGLLGPIYCDNRLLLSKPAERKFIVNQFVKKIKDSECDVIAGVATASIAWAALVSNKLKKPMIYIRKEAKDHGKENLIEGMLENGEKVLVIEDLVTTGGTSLSAVSAARAAGGKVDTCMAIFSYGLRAAKEGFENSRCKLVALTDFNALTKVAAKKGFIKKEELQILLDWNSNPAAWIPKV